MSMASPCEDRKVVPSKANSMDRQESECLGHTPISSIWQVGCAGTRELELS